MSGVQARGLSLLLGALAGLALACEEPDVPVGPPRCEPEREHELDRRLKLGFKALLLGDNDRARQELGAVLAEDATHPEARLGMRLAEGRQAIGGSLGGSGAETPGAASHETPTGAAASQRVELAGTWLEVGVKVDAGRWRFEELRELAPLRRARDGAGAVFQYFRARSGGAEPVSASDPEAARAAIDLIVLHDTHTRTAREAIVELEGRGGSTHFVIDWDGAVYQTLDLAWEANHSQQQPIDARSVSIDLVNPVELGDEPGLPDEAEARGEHRPLSDFVRIQSEEVQQWGYTEAQLRSLEALVRALGKHLPRVPMQVPAGASVPRAVLADPERVRGVVGHLHVSRRAADPGAGFPWESFGTALRGP